MAETPRQTDVAERLRQLQSVRSLTIQEMADLCRLPKRSLENYMNLKNPQRPGVDALISIADGMGVTIDWLVGRTDGDALQSFTKESYALFCQSTVLLVLIRLMDAVKKHPEGVFDTENGRIMGMAPHDIASVAMLDFVRIADTQSGHPSRPMDYHRRGFEGHIRRAQEHLETGFDWDDNARKP